MHRELTWRWHEVILEKNRPWLLHYPELTLSDVCSFKKKKSNCVFRNVKSYAGTGLCNIVYFSSIGNLWDPTSSSQSQEDIHPISGLGRPISGLGCPISDTGWTSSRLREELVGSRKKNDPTSDPLGVAPFSSDPISETDLGSDRIWIHLLGI